MTLSELLDQLKLLDEVTLVEILDLHSDEIVDRFQDIIENRYDEITAKVDEPRETEESYSRREPLSGYLDWTPNEEEDDFGNTEV